MSPRRPSPTTVIACVALFFAIAGGSAIALKGRNSVDSGDIKKGAVKTSDIANNAVTTKKIKNNHVRAADIQANAVGASEIGDRQVGSAELTPNEPFHRVGSPGEPAFGTGGESDCLWSNLGMFGIMRTAPAAFYKDAYGVVHLLGVTHQTPGSFGDQTCDDTGPESLEDGVVFVLPPGYRPQYDEAIVGASSGTTFIVGNSDLVTPQGTLPAGAVFATVRAVLDGFTFRAAGAGTGLPRR